MVMTLRTSTPPTYLLPTGEEMRAAADAVGLRSFSRDLVADLINLAAGGEINPPSSYRGRVLDEVEEKLPAPDSDGEWKLSSGRWTKDRQEAVNDSLNRAMAYHQAVADFLETVDLSKFPGQTPLQQAMSMLKLLSQQEGGSGGGENGERLPIFIDNDNPEKTAEQLSDIMDEVDSLSKDEQELLDPDGNWQNGRQENGSNESLNRLKVAEDLMAGKQEILDISRNLDKLSKMQVHRQKKVEADPDGAEIQTRPLKGLSELARVSKTAWATRQQSGTYFLYQAVSGQLQVRERVTRQDRKQVIFILVDGSGSMRSGHRHYKASGVVMNRIKAVIAGDAEVYLAVFDDRMYDPYHAATPEEAKVLMKKFMGKNFSGGCTDIAAAIKAAYDFIQEEMKNRDDIYRPEIVVLTDDDSSVSRLKKSDIPGAKVHGFAMETRNRSLVDFCKSTGGIGIDNM